MSTAYSVKQPERSDIEALEGTIAVDFGTDWCGFCQSAAPLIEEALQETPDVRHVKVEDGPGRPLGRSFRIKLWPTVVVLKNGREVARVVRPVDANEVKQALAQTVAA